MAGLEFLWRRLDRSIHSEIIRTQKSKLFDLVDLLPETGIDLVGVENTVRCLVMLSLARMNRTYKRWTSGKVIENTNST